MHASTRAGSFFRGVCEFVHTQACQKVVSADAARQQCKSVHVTENALQRRINRTKAQESTAALERSTLKHFSADPFVNMAKCRHVLRILDDCGWRRSFFQSQFHDDFLRACTRIFWKALPPAVFARDHKTILKENCWDNLAQEILISTPRRFGKTISVSMFAAAMIVSCPSVEISIYSTCKRISQKLLRNVTKFIMIIANQDLSTVGMSIQRHNMEEMVLQGPGGATDIRVINSYPSKVSLPLP